METNVCAGPSEFTDSVHPLLAACAHNKEFGRLLKLPDEILLTILSFLLPDLRDIYSIRRVCRRLRSVTDDYSLAFQLFNGHNIDKGSHMLYHDRFISRENSRAPFRIVLPLQSEPEFQLTIMKDTLCKPCQAAHGGRMPPKGCVFIESSEKNIHCGGCHSHHNTNSFSHAQRQREARDRVCIGREGRLRLCEHVSIGWADIEDHLVASSRKADFFEAVSDFHIACEHPSHNFACKSTSRPAPSETSCNDHTRPCARLQIDRNSPDSSWAPISLVLCWKPYSSFMTLAAPENGQIEATKLRELFGVYGKDAARFIVPGPNQNTTPEMLCFDPDQCGHILYRNGERPQVTIYERLSTPHPSSEPEDPPEEATQEITEIPLDADHKDASRFKGLGQADHYVEFNEARGQSGIYVYECPEDHDGQDPSRCLMTSYRRAIHLGHLDRRRPGELNPSHQWFHAVDQDSYASIGAEVPSWAEPVALFLNPKSRPRCRDAACRNYFQSPGPWHEHDMHRPCRISLGVDGQPRFCWSALARLSRADCVRLYRESTHCLDALLRVTTFGIVCLFLMLGG